MLAFGFCVVQQLLTISPQGLCCKLFNVRTSVHIFCNEIYDILMHDDLWTHVDVMYPVMWLYTHCTMQSDFYTDLVEKGKSLLFVYKRGMF